jgi:hypothetical protein
MYKPCHKTIIFIKVTFMKNKFPSLLGLLIAIFAITPQSSIAMEKWDDPASKPSKNKQSRNGLNSREIEALYEVRHQERDGAEVSEAELLERGKLWKRFYKRLERYETQLMKCELTKYYAQYLFPLNPSPYGVFEYLSQLRHHKVDTEMTICRSGPMKRLPPLRDFDRVYKAFESIGYKYQDLSEEQALLLAHKHKLPIMSVNGKSDYQPFRLTSEEYQNYRLHEIFTNARKEYCRDYERLVMYQQEHRKILAQGKAENDTDQAINMAYRQSADTFIEEMKKRDRMADLLKEHQIKSDRNLALRLQKEEYQRYAARQNQYDERIARHLHTVRFQQDLG